MSTINYVIIEVESAYNNTVKLGKNEFVVNSTIESVKHINRVARVVEAPKNTVLNKGDEVIVHHNILRLKNGVGGFVVKSNYHIEDNKYYVPLTEVFMYKRGDSDWVALDPYCFVKPIKLENIIKHNIELNPDTHKGMAKLRGVMAYPNKVLKEFGLKSGDKVIFSEYSEYEFNVDGELYYKMSTNDILAIIE